MAEHEAWSALTREDVIDPELPICDAHHHLWSSPDRHYSLEELFQPGRRPQHRSDGICGKFVSEKGVKRNEDALSRKNWSPGL